MMTVGCYNCGSEEHEFYYRENGYNMVRCNICGLLYVRERPDNETIRVSTVMGHHPGDEDLSVDAYHNRGIKAHYRRMLSEIYGDNFSWSATWLDIGCGYGEFIETLHEESRGQIHIVGLEPNRKKSASARSRGLDVRDSSVDAHSAQYEAVSLLNVYSHLPDPKAFLRRVTNMMKPGAELLIQTGDAAGLSSAEMLKPLGLPDHLSFTSRELLEQMLEELGFRIISVNHFPSLPLQGTRLLKETVKLLLPNHHSYLKYYFHWKRYARMNMYLRATLPPQSE